MSHANKETRSSTFSSSHLGALHLFYLNSSVWAYYFNYKLAIYLCKFFYLVFLNAALASFVSFIFMKQLWFYSELVFHVLFPTKRHGKLVHYGHRVHAWQSKPPICWLEQPRKFHHYADLTELFNCWPSNRPLSRKYSQPGYTGSIRLLWFFHHCIFTDALIDVVLGKIWCRAGATIWMLLICVLINHLYLYHNRVT